MVMLVSDRATVTHTPVCSELATNVPLIRGIADQPHKEKGTLTVYVGCSLALKAQLAKMPPNPPPMRHTAEATARLEWEVILFA